MIDKPFHSLFFYLPRSALDGIADQSRTQRVGELACELGSGHDDAVIRHIGASLMEGLRRPADTNQLFIDHMMLALTAHVAQTYGGLTRRAEPVRGGLAPWQLKRVCERLDADLGGTLSLQQIAIEFGLSASHFSRAFRISTGLPPHQWLLRQRVNTAKQLMSVRDLPLSEIAISAGFANQSHFTRVFSSMVGVMAGQRIYDTTSGLKVIGRQTFPSLTNWQFIDFHAEALVYLMQLGYRIGEFPITVAERRHGTTMYSTLSHIKYPLKTALMVVLGLVQANVTRRRPS